MFALEIDFHDGVSPPEVLLIRRPNAVVGTSDFAHVVIEGGNSGFQEFRVTRGVGRELRCVPLKAPDRPGQRSTFRDGPYTAEAGLNFGEVTTRVIALDLDLRLVADESPDKAGVRILRKALTSSSPHFPAVAVLGPNPVIVSFPAEQPVIIGRSRKCGLRLDSSDVSGEHARIGFSNDSFWVEDLGSTNGTFVGEERVSGRRMLQNNDVVRIGAEYMVTAIQNEEDLSALLESLPESGPPQPSAGLYPSLISDSHLVRPSRFLLNLGMPVTIGRDPANDIWVGAAHISRSHAEVKLRTDGVIEVTDLSSNGTFYKDEELSQGVPTELSADVSVFSLGEGINLAICQSEEDEKDFFGADMPPVKKASMTDIEFPPVGEKTPVRLEAVDPAPVDTAVETGQFDALDEPAGSSVDQPLSVFQRMAKRDDNRAVVSLDEAVEQEENPLETVDELAAEFEFSEGALKEDQQLSDFVDLPMNDEPPGGKIGRIIYGFAAVATLGIVLYAAGIWLFGEVFSR